MRLITKTLVAALAICLPLYAFAQEEILSASKSRTALELYSQAGEAKPLRSVPVDKVNWPLAVKEKKSGYLAVQIDGQQYWVRNMHVRVKKTSTANCAAMITRAELTSSTPGVGSGSCK